jgi:hypothetical protein
MLLASILLLAGAGCAVTPAPAWQADVHDALESFKEAYLAGDLRAAGRYFQDARRAAAGTGRPDLVARVDLIRCAIGTAALDFDACKGSEASQADLQEGDRAYAGFLSGKVEAARAALLPEQYRPLAAAKDGNARARALREIEDPVSRLVAAGALFRAGELSPEGVTMAVDTASEQAWRSPLLAFLNVQLALAEAGGDTAMLQALRKRIELVTADPPGTQR